MLGMNVFKESFTLFKKSSYLNHFNIDILYYKPNYAYIVDVSKVHCGVNLSNETRYLLSVSLTRPVTVESTVEYINKNFAAVAQLEER